MALIEKAVSLKPDDGYIVDSLGWAHFQQNNFKEAVRYLERAVELRPEDPVLNDHLGDACGGSGRSAKHASSGSSRSRLKPETDDAEKIAASSRTVCHHSPRPSSYGRRGKRNQPRQRNAARWFTRRPTSPFGAVIDGEAAWECFRDSGAVCRKTRPRTSSAYRACLALVHMPSIKLPSLP